MGVVFWKELADHFSSRRFMILLALILVIGLIHLMFLHVRMESVFAFLTPILIASSLVNQFRFLRLEAGFAICSALPAAFPHSSSLAARPACSRFPFRFLFKLAHPKIKKAG